MRLSLLSSLPLVGATVIVGGLATPVALAGGLPPGGHYTGTLVNGQRHGLGSYVTPQGKCFEGQFIQGEPHGFGVLWNSKGLRPLRCGLWVPGRRFQRLTIPRSALPTPNRMSSWLATAQPPLPDFQVLTPEGSFYLGSKATPCLPNGAGTWFFVDGREPQSLFNAHGRPLGPGKAGVPGLFAAAAPSSSVAPGSVALLAEFAQGLNFQARCRFRTFSFPHQEQIRQAVLDDAFRPVQALGGPTLSWSGKVLRYRVTASGNLVVEEPLPLQANAAVLPMLEPRVAATVPSCAASSEADPALAEMEEGWQRAERRLVELMVDAPEPSPSLRRLKAEGVTLTPAVLEQILARHGQGAVGVARFTGAFASTSALAELIAEAFLPARANRSLGSYWDLREGQPWGMTLCRAKEIVGTWDDQGQDRPTCHFAVFTQARTACTASEIRMAFPVAAEADGTAFDLLP